MSAATKAAGSLRSRRRRTGSSERISRSALAGDSDLRYSINGSGSPPLWLDECSSRVNGDVWRSAAAALPPLPLPASCSLEMRERSAAVGFVPASCDGISFAGARLSRFDVVPRKKGAWGGALGGSLGLFRCWVSQQRL